MAVKTNALRLLDKAGIPYTVREFPLDGERAAVDVPAYLHIERDRLFKTLVTTDTNGGYYVFCVPTSRELDLKKAAAAAGTKRIEMLRQKDLQPLTGYIHGGCSPVGMKKVLPTVVDASARDWERIVVSAGRRGVLMELDPLALERMVGAAFGFLTK